MGFAIQTPLARNLHSIPKGLLHRIKVFWLKLSRQTYATIVSVYAPTMTQTYVVKDSFYEEHKTVISTTIKKDTLILLGDFHARVGSDHVFRPNVLGKHKIGKCNSNGELLLSKCASHELFITQIRHSNKLTNARLHGCVQDPSIGTCFTTSQCVNVICVM